MLHDRLERDATAQWNANAPAYRKLVNDASHSSNFLRETGLKPEMARLIGDCSDLSLLDVGTGNGWLFDLVFPREAHACDLIEPPQIAPHVRFEKQDASAMHAYEDESFDIVASSLVLCYCEDLDAVLREFARVTKANGALVVALVHPYFYRTGDTSTDGDFRIHAELSGSGAFAIEIGRSVGPFRYHYRSMPHYLNAMIGAGWTIERVDDWFMDPDKYAASGVGEDGIPRTHKVPIFSFFRCLKQRRQRHRPPG